MGMGMAVSNRSTLRASARSGRGLVPGCRLPPPPHPRSRPPQYTLRADARRHEGVVRRLAVLPRAISLAPLP